MNMKLSITAIATAFTLTVALPLFQTVVPATGSPAAFAKSRDDHGGKRGGRGDDAASHDAKDDHGGLRGGRGADDGAGHDAHDDHGGQRGKK